MRNRYELINTRLLCILATESPLQYECSFHYCLSPFLQEKTNLERFFPPVLNICFTNNLKPGSYVRGDVNFNKKGPPFTPSYKKVGAYSNLSCKHEENTKKEWSEYVVANDDSLSPSSWVLVVNVKSIKYYIDLV